jgi:hypothetical protein
MVENMKRKKGKHIYIKIFSLSEESRLIGFYCSQFIVQLHASLRK